LAGETSGEAVEIYLERVPGRAKRSGKFLQNSSWTAAGSAITELPFFL
jgi:hypothetical protein